jgi:hypothetical protein
MLAGVAVVAGVMYVAAASGSQQSKGPSAKQFSALKKQVAGLSHQVKTLSVVLQVCMQGAVPINDFGDAQNGTFGYHYLDSTKGEVLTTALDVTSKDDPNALWITGSIGTTCIKELGGFLRHEAARTGVKLQPLSLPSTFAVHRH